MFVLVYSPDFLKWSINCIRFNHAVMMYVRMTTSTDRQSFSKWVTFETIRQVGLSNRQPVTRESVHDTVYKISNNECRSSPVVSPTIATGPGRDGDHRSIDVPVGGSSCRIVHSFQRGILGSVPLYLFNIPDDFFLHHL